MHRKSVEHATRRSSLDEISLVGSERHFLTCPVFPRLWYRIASLQRLACFKINVTLRLRCAAFRMDDTAARIIIHIVIVKDDTAAFDASFGIVTHAATSLM